MAYQFDFNSTSQPGGTLQSNELYHRPPVPRTSQAEGIQGTDDRAYTGQVQGNELVENRLTNLLNRDSRYIESARRRGLSDAAKRGMLNSSIAQGASERSAIEAGLPIAAADAETYSKTRLINQEALNQNLMQERDIANRMLSDRENRLSASADRQAMIDQANKDREMGLMRQREQLAFQGEQSGLDRQQQEMMSRLGYTHDLGRLGAGFHYDVGRTGLEMQRMRFADNLAYNEAYRQDWLQSNQFNRDFYGNIALNFQNAQLRDSSDFYARLTDALVQDPQVFGNPQFLSGIRNFFQTEMFDNYFNTFMEGFFNRGRG